MKVAISNISEVYVGEYKLTREIDNGFIVEKIDASVDYYEKDHKYLLERLVNGDDKSEGIVTIECGDPALEKSVFIKHNEGEIDLINCKTTKEVTLTNVLDCIANGSINIFDYDRTTISTIQGEVDNIVVEIDTLTSFDGNFTINDVLPKIGVNLDIWGYYIESGLMAVKGQVRDEGYVDEYYGHTIKGHVVMARIRSDIKHSDLWYQIDPFDPSEGYFYSGIETPEWYKTDGSTRVSTADGDVYSHFFRIGRQDTLSKIEISNTVSLNTVLVDAFSCTNKTLISNFLNINTDGTAPSNSQYNWAATYASNIMVIQAYDIIKESAENDSFGDSGILKIKSLLKNIFTAYGLNLTVDGDNIRLEHLTYFTDKGISIKDVDYEFKPLKANKDRIDSETFSFAKKVNNEGFFQAKIEYENNNLYSEDNDQPYRCDLFVTDVFGAINNESLAEEGTFEKYFFFLCTDGESIIELNKPFAMESLVKELHNTNRPMKRGLINGEPIIFSTNSLGLTGEITMRSNGKQWDILKPLMSIETNEGFYLIDNITIDEGNLLTIKIKK